MKSLITLIIVILFFGGLFYMTTKDTPPLNEETGNTSTSTSTGSSTESLTVENYIRQNISQLSPIKEQLGGTFYVTNLKLQNGTGTVEYEDGHNAYTADFTYATSATGTVILHTFRVKE